MPGHQEEPQVSPSPLTGGCHSLVLMPPHPKLLHLEKPDQAILRLPGRAWRGVGGALEPGGGGGGARARCACVSGPYLFSPLLILVPPAAPHTKPHSPNPQGVGKGGQLYSAALFRASYPCSSAGSSQQCWPWCPLHWTLPEVSPGKSSSRLFLVKLGPLPSLYLLVLGGGHALAGIRGHCGVVDRGSHLCFIPPSSPQSLPATSRRWGRLDSGPSFKRAAHWLGRSSRPDSEGSLGGWRTGGVMGRGPVLPPTRQTDLAWCPGIAAPPTTTHTHAHKVLARGGMPAGWGRAALTGRQGAGPSGMQRWEGCPRWGGHPGTSAPPWQKEGGGLHPTHPFQMMGLGVPPWPGWHQYSSRWHLSWHQCQSPG